jgi:hypothetical protein
MFMHLDGTSHLERPYVVLGGYFVVSHLYEGDAYIDETCDITTLLFYALLTSRK